ncbi:MAG TPA: hypothetical protein VF920_08605 [Dongiaceae bacterium]
MEANLILERRYLELGRAQIDEMCLDLKARLAARMSAGLRDRLAAAPSPAVEISAPDIMAADVAHQVEAAAAMAAKLLNDISWVLPWEQAKSLVEPYARGSWLLAQIQVAEEQRVVSIFAAELTQQATSYMRDLIFRFYGVDQAPTSDAVRPAERPGTLEQG